MVWMVIFFIACMAVDYLTGTGVAIKTGKWESKAAREGLWHKLGSVIAVAVAGGADLLIGSIINNMPAVTLPFEYPVFLSPLVLAWYIITEMGSIIENAGAVGAPIPSFLRKIIAQLHDATDAAGDKLAGTAKEDK